MKELKRIRLGNHLIGMRLERLPHSMVFRLLVSHVADTAGVLNRFNNTDDMCMFMDFDDKVTYDEIDTILNDLSEFYDLTFHLFKTSENHYNAISTTLIPKDILDEMMKSYMKYMDYRFVYVYFRDGCNAMRIIPKFVSGRIYRPIAYIKSYHNDELGHGTPIDHRGLSQYLTGLYDIPFPEMTDDSAKEDLIIREYETINW